jgi:uncharacterized protein YndB with AHSA1/START domain
MPAAQTQTIRIERVFDCTPDELWEAWTTAEEFARWISPLADCDAEVIAFDPRPGGRLAWRMACPAGEAIFEDCFFEVVNRPHELVIYQPHAQDGHPLTGVPLTMRVRFVAEGEQTRMLFEQSGFPADATLEGAYAGLGTNFTKMAAIVAARA